MKEHSKKIKNGWIIFILLLVLIIPNEVKAKIDCNDPAELISKYNIDINKKNKKSTKKYTISAFLDSSSIANRCKNKKCELEISLENEDGTSKYIDTLVLEKGDEKDRKDSGAFEVQWRDEDGEKYFVVNIVLKTDKDCPGLKVIYRVNKAGDDTVSIPYGNVDYSDLDANDINEMSDVNCDANEFNRKFCDARLLALQPINHDKSGDLQSGKDKMKDTSVNKLTCNYNVASNEIKEWNTNENGDDGYYLNKQYYYAKSTVTTQLDERYEYHYDSKNPTYGDPLTCTRTCEEAVTVEYGPPVAVRAGLCFQYKVKVTSRVVCKVTDKPKKPDNNAYNLCTPVPLCTNATHDYVSNQAGPNEDFEQCIQKCDGGKYSQKCSLKCYQEVYGKKNNQKTKLALLEDASVSRLATSSTWNREKCIEASSEKRDQLGGNSYDTNLDNKNDGLYSYGCYYRNYDNDGNVTSISYQRSSTIKEWNLEKGGATWYWYYNHKNYLSPTRYEPDTEGIYRRVIGSGHCTDICWWSGCDNDQQYLNSADIDYDKKTNKEIYAHAKSSCSAKATCNTTTTEYTIAVKYDTEDKDGKVTTEKVYFPYTKNQNSKFTLGSGKNSGVVNNKAILQYDGCYRTNEANKWYMTEWTIPMTWQDKDLDANYDGNGNGLTPKEYQFCMKRNLRSVNTKWWDCYQTYAASNKTAEDRQKLTSCYNASGAKDYKDFNNGDSNGYNIEATTKDFGYFEWNFNIQCFYAASTSSVSNDDSSCNCINGTESCCPPKIDIDNCPGEDCPHPDSYTIRSVELTDLFPSTQNRKIEYRTTETGRQVGFNWTSDATINTSKNPFYGSSYAKKPNDLITTIQSLGDSIYTQDDKYLEYEFTLTPEKLQQIRKETRDTLHGEYSNFDYWKTKTTVYKNFNSSSKAQFYTSPLITSLGGRKVTPGCNTKDCK